MSPEPNSRTPLGSAPISGTVYTLISTPGGGEALAVITSDGAVTSAPVGLNGLYVPQLAVNPVTGSACVTARGGGGGGSGVPGANIATTAVTIVDKDGNAEVVTLPGTPRGNQSGDVVIVPAYLTFDSGVVVIDTAATTA